jgi:hypothetical protein
VEGKMKVGCDLCAAKGEEGGGGTDGGEEEAASVEEQRISGSGPDFGLHAGEGEERGGWRRRRGGAGWIPVG